MTPAQPHRDASSILFVDDEPQSCKWFARTFGDEFPIITASGVSEALALMRLRKDDLALLVTDYRMPERNGLELLQIAQTDFRHLVRLLATAYAEKEVAIAAVNHGQVFKILEKPLDGQHTRAVLREALALFRKQEHERALHENRVLAMRDTLGFLAHELNTPLATIRGYMGALKERHRALEATDGGTGAVQFTQDRPGEILAAVEAAERSALHCQSLVSTFVQSARDAHPGAGAQSASASSLVKALLDDFPFEGDEHHWVSSEVQRDFVLPGRRDLLYLVLCTLTKNALLAMRERPEPRLRIVLGGNALADGRVQPWIRFHDNGHGIVPEVLAKLTVTPVTTRAQAGGNGMGLMFCRRVVQSIGGSIAIASESGDGATVTLMFQPVHEPHPGRIPHDT